MAVMPTDPFIGSWELDPAQSEYQFGSAPQMGLYGFEASGEGYLVSLAWTDAQGQNFHHTYSAIPDGVQYPYENPQIAEYMSMTRLDERTLDSATFKGGKRIAYGLRVLSEDGQTMTITQSGFRPDGTPFENRSVYVRQA